jgi:multisubunit Na+/H+ antiporter MnhF subunit
LLAALGTKLDTEDDMNLHARPKILTITVILVAASTLLAFVRLIFDPEFVNFDNKQLVYISNAISVLVSIIVLTFIWFGKNWARYIYLALLVLGAYPTMQEILKSLSNVPMIAIVLSVQLLIQVGGVFVFFHPTINKWVAGKNA